MSGVACLTVPCIEIQQHNCCSEGGKTGLHASLTGLAQDLSCTYKLECIPCRAVSQRPLPSETESSAASFSFSGPQVSTSATTHLSEAPLRKKAAAGQPVKAKRAWSLAKLALLGIGLVAGVGKVGHVTSAQNWSQHAAPSGIYCSPACRFTSHSGSARPDSYNMVQTFLWLCDTMCLHTCG